MAVFDGQPPEEQAFVQAREHAARARCQQIGSVTLEREVVADWSFTIATVQVAPIERRTEYLPRPKKEKYEEPELEEAVSAS